MLLFTETNELIYFNIQQFKNKALNKISQHVLLFAISMTVYSLLWYLVVTVDNGWSKKFNRKAIQLR